MRFLILQITALPPICQPFFTTSICFIRHKVQSTLKLSERLNFSHHICCLYYVPLTERSNTSALKQTNWSCYCMITPWCLLDDVANADPNADQKCWPRMLTVKERPLVKFFQYTGIFSVSRGSPRATKKSQRLSFLLLTVSAQRREEPACGQFHRVNRCLYWLLRHILKNWNDLYSLALTCYKH